MPVGQYIAQGAAFAAGVLLSCGPSQIFGIIKGGIDLIRLASLQRKISTVNQAIEHQKKTAHLTDHEISAIPPEKVAKYRASFDNQLNKLKADGLALIPFIGAISSWRTYMKGSESEKIPATDLTQKIYTPSDTPALFSGKVSVLSEGAPLDTESLIAPRDIEDFEKTIDDIEVDWRANEKYHHVTSQIVKGLDSELASNPPISALKATLLSLQEQKPLDTSEGKCRFYTAKALTALHCAGDKTLFTNERTAYKEYKNFLREALETDFYKNNPNSTALAQLLNTLAYTEFSKVNTQAFTESVAEKFTEKKGLSAPSGTDVVQSPTELMSQMLKEMRSFHESRKNESEVLSTIRGEVMFLGLDSTVQGNPTNVKFRVENKDGKEITNVRTPTPTGKDGQVTAEFKAFLRHIKSRGETYALINLQNRRYPGVIRTIFGFNGEYLRSRNLEALVNDPEFKDTITCFTIDKNSEFFSQKENIDKDFEDFKKEFMSQLTDPERKSGFFLPPSWLNDEKKLSAIQNKLEMVHETLFSQKKQLTSKERQDFIEVAYIFLADYFIKETGASYYNESCKDCIDRGGGANWTMMTLLTILEIHDKTRKAANSPPLEERIANLPAKFEEDAIWARKRPVTQERLNRAEGAATALMNASTNPENIERWINELNFKKIIIEKDQTQVTRAFR